jgi:hypothetical protein
MTRRLNSKFVEATENELKDSRNQSAILDIEERKL